MIMFFLFFKDGAQNRKDSTFCTTQRVHNRAGGPRTTKKMPHVQNRPRKQKSSRAVMTENFCLTCWNTSFAPKVVEGWWCIAFLWPGDTFGLLYPELEGYSETKVDEKKNWKFAFSPTHPPPLSSTHTPHKWWVFFAPHTRYVQSWLSTCLRTYPVCGSENTTHYTHTNHITPGRQRVQWVGVF